MNNIPTAEDFIKNEYETNYIQSVVAEPNHIIFMMQEFAKLHVEAALKRAHSNMQLPEEDLEFTLKSYPLTNIK